MATAAGALRRWAEMVSTREASVLYFLTPLALGAFADPAPGVALTTVPVDVMKTTPDDCCAGCSLDPNQLYALTQDKAGHYMAVSDFH